MIDMPKCEVYARDLVEQLLPYLPASSADIKDEYDAGEYIAAAQGAVHDLGILRADIPENLILDIEALLTQIEDDAVPFYMKFLPSMRVGYSQLSERRKLVDGKQSA
jgi:hypothetical protein